MIGGKKKAKKGDGSKRVRHRDTAFLVALGQNLKKIRSIQGYSIDRIYLETPNLSRATISRIERGEADPQISTLKRIAATLKVKLTKLIDFD